MSNETSVTTNPTGSSRRAVLRAGAHAAWAVPAVQVATMVPAMAASGDTAATVAVTAAKDSVSVGQNNADASSFIYTFDVKVTQSGPIDGLQLHFSNTSGYDVTFRSPASIAIDGGSSGWSVSNASGSGPLTVTFAGLVAKDATVSVRVKFSNCFRKNNGSWNVTATPSTTQNSTLVPTSFNPYA